MLLNIFKKKKIVCHREREGEKTLMLLLFYFQKQWEEGLQAMDQAINDMPRTKHRLYVLFH